MTAASVKTEENHMFVRGDSHLSAVDVASERSFRRYVARLPASACLSCLGY